MEPRLFSILIRLLSFLTKCRSLPDGVSQMRVALLVLPAMVVWGVIACIVLLCHAGQCVYVCGAGFGTGLLFLLCLGPCRATVVSAHVCCALSSRCAPVLLLPLAVVFYEAVFALQLP